MINLSSFLLIADDTLPLSLNKDMKHSLKAHLIYSLLFEDRILLSDRQMINNRNFRQLIRENDTLINCLNPTNFSIGIRNYVDMKTESNGSRQNIYTPDIKTVLKGYID